MKRKNQLFLDKIFEEKLIVDLGELMDCPEKFNFLKIMEFSDKTTLTQPRWF